MGRNQTTFGNSVALSSGWQHGSGGGRMPTQSLGTDYQGAGYVFTTRWKLEPTGGLTASDGVYDDEFGISVACRRDGNTALVGALFPPSMDTTYKERRCG